MKRAHLLLQLCQDVVHHTLFFEILCQLPHGLAFVLAEVARLVEQHGAPMALLLAVVVSLLRFVLAVRPPEPPAGEIKNRNTRKRDKKGRFVKTNRKEP